MQRALSASVLVALVVGGCAAAVPGYVPSTPQRERMLAAAPKGGGVDQQGVYQLTDQEQKLDCKQLSGSITIKILQMREAGSRANASKTAGTVQDLLRPLKGTTTYGINTETDLANDRLRLEALNRQLTAKDCRVFDLEAELKPGNTAPPRPVGEPKAKPKSK